MCNASKACARCADICFPIFSVWIIDALGKVWPAFEVQSFWAMVFGFGRDILTIKVTEEPIYDAMVLSEEKQW